MLYTRMLRSSLNIKWYQRGPDAEIYRVDDELGYEMLTPPKGHFETYIFKFLLCYSFNIRLSPDQKVVTVGGHLQFKMAAMENY